MLASGEKAPGFAAASTAGEMDLSDLLKRGPVVLYFFPRAMTGGCTTEALEFNGLLGEFSALGATVVGVSVDPVSRQQRFREKYDLHFDLVSDHSREIGSAYGTLKGDETTTHERDTVVLSGEGSILLAYRKVRAQGHAAAVLSDMRQLHEEGLL